MHNQLSQQLKKWYPNRDQQLWVLGTLYHIEGPSYRKPGAMMLFNDLGEQYGLLSGGCLESDIQQHAAKVMASQQPKTLCYDANDEDDRSFLLGIGCGGKIYILLQPLSKDNNYLQLEQVMQALEQRCDSILLQKICDQSSTAEVEFLLPEDNAYSEVSAQLKGKNALLVKQGEQTWLANHIKPNLHLLVVGGGVDAQPLVQMALTLGWELTVCDPRPANARREHFMGANNILRCAPQALKQEALFSTFNAAIVMTHNLQLDADAIVALQESSVKYLALLGPEVRKQQVLALGGLKESQLTCAIAGPAGLRLGGELPEEIALSVLAECQAVIKQMDGLSISELLSGQFSGQLNDQSSDQL